LHAPSRSQRARSVVAAASPLDSQWSFEHFDTTKGARQPGLKGQPIDRVGRRGLRPGTLPHHRTCGFPHPAVERSGVLPSPVRSQFMPDTRPGWATSSFGPCLVSPESRPKLSCSAASSVRSRSGQNLAWLPLVLRPFALPGFRRASSLLWPLLTSPGLSAGGSPRVSVCSFRSRRWALHDVASDSWASRLLAHSPPTPCLSAHSCSCGRTFAFHPFAPAPCGDDLAVRLRLASQAPDGNLSSRKTRHLPGTLAEGNALGRAWCEVARPERAPQRAPFDGPTAGPPGMPFQGE